MHKIFVLAYIFTISWCVSAKENKIIVTSRGDNLSNVLYDFFKKANKNFVLDKEVIKKSSDIKLYLNFSEVTFKAALEAICKNYGLKVDQKENIYYLSLGTYPDNSFLAEARNPKNSNLPAPLPEPERVEDKKTNLENNSHFTVKKRVPRVALKRIVTVRFKRVDLRHLLQVLGKQAGVTIEVSKNVPLYRLDAFLIKTSLEYALREITRQTKLAYEFTDHETLHVFKK